MSRTKVFVSYCHDDRDWLTKFAKHVAVLERRGLIDVWSDTRIAVGEAWEREIETALSSARVAVLMVSPAFLASEYIWKYEMPRIVAHTGQGMDALPLIVRPCAWRIEETLARLQARPTDGRPLSLGSEGQIDLDLSAFAYELAARVGKSPAAIPPSVSEDGEPELVPPKGEWAGYYNRTRPMRLLIREIHDQTFRGRLEYPAEGTVTNVEGVIHERWSPDDATWAQVGGANADRKRLAISFRETGYEVKGSSSISFEGEYRALVQGSDMTGAWFAGNRLVGSLTLQRT